MASFSDTNTFQEIIKKQRAPYLLKKSQPLTSNRIQSQEMAPDGSSLASPLREAIKTGAIFFRAKEIAFLETPCNFNYSVVSSLLKILLHDINKSCSYLSVDYSRFQRKNTIPCQSFALNKHTVPAPNLSPQQGKNQTPMQLGRMTILSMALAAGFASLAAQADCSAGGACLTPNSLESESKTHLTLNFRPFCSFNSEFFLMLWVTQVANTCQKLSTWRAQLLKPLLNGWSLPLFLSIRR